MGRPQIGRGALSGYSGTPLAQKLGIRAGQRLLVQAAPGDYLQLIGPVPEGIRLVKRIDRDTDLVHIFAAQRAKLSGTLRSARRAMRADAVIWVSWPKKSSGVLTDITEDVIRELALPLQLVDVKVCAVDDTWSGLKLVIRKEHRGAGERTRDK